VRNGRLIGLKSHDMHVMVQQLLGACVRHLMHPAQRHAIIRVGKTFQRLCSTIFFRILDSGPTSYYVLELEAQVVTLICLVVFLLAILEKIKNRIWLFSPWRGDVFGYFKL
jgi:hypothetical protein